MANKYDIPDYDKYLCLRVDLTLWGVILYLVHPYWLLILSITNLKDKTGLINAVYPDRLPMSLAAAAAIPALFVIYAWMKRRPEASDRVRWIWRHGRWFLTASSLLYITIAALRIALGSIHETHYLVWLQLAAVFLIALYLFTSARVRDTFSDFPDDAAGPDK